MSGGDVDLSEMNEDQMELLLRRIEEVKRMKREKTPEPSYSTKMGNSYAPEQTEYMQEQTNYRQEPANYMQEPTNYMPEPANYRQEPANYMQEPTNYRQEPANYMQEPANYRQEPTNYRQEPTNYRQEPTNYRQEPANYRQEPTNYRPEPVRYRQEQTNYREERTTYRQEPTYRQDVNYRHEQSGYRQDLIYRQERSPYREDPMYIQEQPIYRQERSAYRREPAPGRVPNRNQYSPETGYSGFTADSDSDDLESLESFISSNLTPDLPDEEWLFVSPVTRPTEQQRRVRVLDWLRMGSEDEFDGIPDYKPARRTDYNRSPPVSAAFSRYKSPPQPPPPKTQSPLEIVDILSGGPSRYIEQLEKRTFSPPPCHPEFQRDTNSPLDPYFRPSPDYTRESVVSPSRGQEQTAGYRFSPQGTTGNSFRRHDSPGIPARESPSPKLSGGRGGSPLDRMSPSYQRNAQRYTPVDETQSSEEPVYVPSTTPDRERQLRREAQFQIPDRTAPQMLPAQTRGVTPPQIGRPGIRPPGIARPSGGLRAPQAPSGLRQPRSSLPNPAVSRAPRRPDS